MNNTFKGVILPLFLKFEFNVTTTELGSCRYKVCVGTSQLVVNKARFINFKIFLCFLYQLGLLQIYQMQQVIAVIHSSSKQCLYEIKLTFCRYNKSLSIRKLPLIPYDDIISSILITEKAYVHIVIILQAPIVQAVVFKVFSILIHCILEVLSYAFQTCQSPQSI